MVNLIKKGYKILNLKLNLKKMYCKVLKVRRLSFCYNL